MEGSKKIKEDKEKRLSQEEVQDRIKKGLCFKCGEKWSKEHKCKASQVFIITKDDEEVEVVEEDALSGDAYL